MTRPLNVVVVNGSPTERSKTMGLTELVTSSLADKLPIETHRVDVYRLGSGFTGAITRDDVTPDVEEALRFVETADVLIAATPVYRATYPGMFKHLFDLVEQYALANKPVILVATGGSDRHALVIEHALRPLFGFFQAATAPVGFYANSGDFEGTLVLNNEVYSRIEIGIGDIVPQLRQLAEADRTTVPF
ncbi:NAD(P)H-dependent oxidoreductase [Paramicrobacterium chengjingii]|uniref:NAD(P)H-dependent oxidoreductase n=1 Tax=Paramicrobacterium chengjingii TaxID=2769067 RepID=A0ABX6YIL1_9MICO|nr:NAD(P)H-dependent oxidoreductase [Microbacterium chengjingii]QPZ38434.1 NAD(P)H-dependent oxidoreductase [Microbacterium chengjingii]